MNFVTVKNGLLNLDLIVYVNKERYSIGLANGETLVVSEEEMIHIYDALVKYITKERVKELRVAQEELSDGT